MASAQHYVYEWLNRDKKVFEKFDLANQVYYTKAFDGEYVKKSNLHVSNLDLRDVPLDKDLAINGFDLVANKTFFTMPGTGFVFEFDRLTYEFKRIDQTFYKGYNFNAFQFVREGKIYSLGGSGFWNIHAILTFYDPIAKEWEMVDTHGEVKPERVLFNMTGYNPKLNKIYVIEPTEEFKVKTPGYFRFFELDIKTLTWTFKGVIDLKKIAEFNVTALDLSWLGTFFLVNRKPENALMLDPEKNELRTYFGEKKLFWGIYQRNFVSGDYVYSLTPQFVNRKTRNVLDSIPLNKIHSYFQVVDKFYESPKLELSFQEVFIGFFSAILIIALIVYFFAFLYKKKKSIKSNSISPDKSIWTMLPLHGEDLLKFVATNGCNYLFTTEEISKILDCDKKAFDTQRQYRSKFISHFNQFFEEHFEIHQAISRITSEDDKRFVCYQVSEKALREYLKIV